MADQPEASQAATDSCVNHPDRAAAERCEICGRALCGECLWYAAEGQRLCQVHAARALAQGRPVHPPEMYADAVEVRGGAAPLPASEPVAAYRGNSADVTALLAAMLGLVTLAICATGSQAVYCLPFMAVILGAIALASVRHAADPGRTRLLSWIGMGTGGAMALAALAFFLAMIACFCGPLWLAALSGPGYVHVTPTP